MLNDNFINVIYEIFYYRRNIILLILKSGRRGKSVTRKTAAWPLSGFSLIIAISDNTLTVRAQNIKSHF